MSKETIAQDKSNTRLLKGLYLTRLLLLLTQFVEEKEQEWSHISACLQGLTHLLYPAFNTVCSVCLLNTNDLAFHFTG